MIQHIVAAACVDGLGHVSHSLSEQLLRKPKQLLLKQNMAKLSDVGPALLATSVARLLPMLTENSLMKLGGDLLEACRISPTMEWGSITSSASILEQLLASCRDVGDDGVLG